MTRFNLNCGVFNELELFLPHHSTTLTTETLFINNEHHEDDNNLNIRNRFITSTDKDTPSPSVFTRSQQLDSLSKAYKDTLVNEIIPLANLKLKLQLAYQELHLHLKLIKD